MYLSKLRIFGFKSFARKTELAFSKGISAIVGPNGCGKTNILDAIRWVIGEQKVKTLRSSSMQDVIFKGSAQRKPLGMSEVHLILKDCKGILPFDPEAETVEIGRRLYRSGDSEYLLNGQTVRLKDIQSILMDTGIGSSIYAIIERSMVEKILTGGREDRRVLLEEAAGIMKYKVDRRASEIKLNNTEDDLERLEDILVEVKKSVNSLKRQMRRAKDLERLKKQAKELAVKLASVQYKRFGEQRGKLSKELAREEEKLALTQAKKSELETRRQNLTMLRDEKDMEVADAREKLRKIETGIAEKEKEEAVLRERITYAEQGIENAVEEAAELRKRAATLSGQAEEVEDKLTEKENQISRLKGEVDRIIQDQAEAEDAYRNIRRENTRLREEFSAVESEIVKLGSAKEYTETRLNSIKDRQSELETSLERINKELEEASEKAGILQSEYDRARENVARIEDELAQIDDTLELVSEDESERIAERSDVVTKIGRLDGRLKALEESVQSATGDVSELIGSLPGIMGRLTELITPAKFPPAAIDRILGGLADSWVAEDSEAGDKAAAKLIENNTNATIIILDELPEGSSDGIKTVSDVEKLRSLVDGFSLGEFGGDGDMVVSPNGDYLKKPGIRIIGRDSRGAVSIAAEIPRLEAEIAEYREKASDLSGEIQKISGKKGALHTKRQDIKKQLEDARQEIESAEKLYSDAEFEVRAGTADKENIKSRLDKLGKEKEELVEKLTETEADLTDAKNKAENLKEQLEKRAKLEEDAEQKSREISRQATDAQMNHIQQKGELERYQRELSRLQMQKTEALSSAEAADKRAEDLKTELEESKNARGGFADTIKELFEKRDVADAELTELAEQSREQGESLRKLDLKIRDVSNELSSVEKLVHERNLEKHDLDMQAGWIRESILSEYDVDIEDVEPDEEISTEQEKKSEIKLERLKRRITDFGGVNPEAEAEYEEEKKRFDFLVEQKKDLIDAGNTLKATIKKLDNTARKQFLSTFEETRRNFRLLFTKLFQGGEADLTLTEGEDVLEADIEIAARPSGKRFLDVNQLSSGEKAMCAISLLFALYEVKPSPFCMLDEVDAPLDEANVTRFLRLLEDFVRDTQFILITHNKRTMEAADYLYGITMQEDGVSKAISLKLSDLALDFGENGK